MLDVGEMDLDGRQRGQLDRVAQRPRVVRPRAGVEQQAVRVVIDLVELLDVLALVVGLEEDRLQLQLVREPLDPVLEDVCVASVSGLGVDGYRAGLERFKEEM